MMKAWVLKEIGNISLIDIEVPAPAPDEVLVRVCSAGICGSDIPRIYETGAHRMPLVPGHEFSGVVEGIGENASPFWSGKRVAVFPKIACKKCPQCRSGHPEMCQDYDYIGSRRDGAFEEYVTVPSENLILLPDSVSFEEAAMLEPLAVAANAVRTGCLRSDASPALDRPVAVCGLGTIGMMVVMLLSEAGFENIYVIGNKESQKKRALALGIPEKNYCDSRNENVPEWLRESSNGGILTYFECVGKNECIVNGIEASLPGGSLILVGNPYSHMSFERDTWWKILRRQMAVYGIWNSSFRQKLNEEEKIDDWNFVLERIKDEKLRPAELISHRLVPAEFEKGLHIMRDKSEDYCKVIIAMNGKGWF